MIRATRRIGIDAGHRVTRHESKCRNVHGHRYEVEITVETPDLDHAGRVVDFGVLKDLVGQWLLDHLDHGYLFAPWDEVGPLLEAQGMKVYRMPEGMEPTAENIARHVLDVAQDLLRDHWAVTLEGQGPFLRVVQVRVWETPNCYADAYPVPRS